MEDGPMARSSLTSLSARLERRTIFQSAFPRVWAAQAVSLTFVALLPSCETESEGLLQPPVEAVGNGIAYGIWTPTGTDTCSKELHDSYSTVGPDGLRYPTWHPPVHPATSCTFGHEHGRDPSGSDLYALVGDIPFGLANQYMTQSSLGVPRNEDHVGHKVEWENDMLMQIGEGGSAAITVRCDVLVKMHQGTHSRDAFTNNMHEVAYHIRCSDGTGFSVTALTPIGQAGELVSSCDREREIFAGTPTPPTSPNGGGHRAIPDVACVQRHVLDGGTQPHFDSALHERWEIHVDVKTANGRGLVSFNPYFQLTDPSRYYDPNAANAVGRPIDLCRMATLRDRDRCRGMADGVNLGRPALSVQGRAPLRGRERQQHPQRRRPRDLVYRLVGSQRPHRAVPRLDPSVDRASHQ
jgi:hypothetical protein